MLYETPNPHGGEVYARKIDLDFSANINPYGTPQAVKDAVAGSVEALRCYPDPYCRRLVSAIADFEKVPEKQVFCGNGAAELIFSCCMALRPKKAMVLSPCFSEYETALKVFGTETAHYLLNRQDNFALTEAFLRVLEGFDGEMLMLCNPNNPTGQVTDRPLMEKILEICQKKGIFLFIDECFLDLTQGGEDISMKPFLEEYRGLFLQKAFTKSYGMAGLRLGYCLSSNQQLLKTMGSQTQPWNVSIPALAAVIGFFAYYCWCIKPKRGSLEWVAMAETKKRPLTLTLRRHPMEKKDILPVLLLTVVYAATAFFRLGDFTAPQSYAVFQADTAVTFSFGQVVEVDEISYFTVLGTGHYTLEYSADGVNWGSIDLDQAYNTLLKWRLDNLNETEDGTTPIGPISAKMFRLTAGKIDRPEGLWLGELALWSQGQALMPIYVDDAGAALFDEPSQWTTESTYMNSSYFDEIYHARTALETPELFAWTLVIIVLSLAMEGALRRLLMGRKGAAA